MNKDPVPSTVPQKGAQPQEVQKHHPVIAISRTTLTVATPPVGIGGPFVPRPETGPTKRHFVHNDHPAMVG